MDNPILMVNKKRNADMKMINHCASKARKLEISPHDAPFAVRKPDVDTNRHLDEMSHIEYVLVPRQFAQNAFALVLSHDQLLDHGLPSWHLSDVSNLKKTSSNATVTGHSILSQDLRRKLAVIFIADVVGYAKLMNENESATVSTLTAYKEKMTRLIEKWWGRVVDSPGDNLMAEFPSVTDAVKCAVTVQKKFKEMNRGLPENRKMEFRIGINLGDVIEHGNRIYGDKVNIAARLEAIADPGGICISRTVYDQIEDKLSLTYKHLGEKKVKNIPKPIEVYGIMMECEGSHSIKPKRKTTGNAEKEIQISPGKKLIENIANYFPCIFGVT
jgi:class 3 adenylate cyclase